MKIVKNLATGLIPFTVLLAVAWFPRLHDLENNLESRARESESDTSSIDAVVKALYESLSFPEGKVPDLERLRNLFTQEASFTRVNKDNKVDLMKTETFIRSFQERMDKGLIKSFHESEIAQTRQVFGQIAQVFSTYRKGINVSDPEKMGRGINSIQLFYQGGRWRICAILWMDERPDCPIPPEFLRSGE